MKKRMSILLLMMTVLIFSSICVHAQVDSSFSLTAHTIVTALTTKFAWANMIINVITVVVTVLVMILPAIQYVLKKVPTTESVKITGILGTLLNWATWWQKDIKSN